tara:strand:- start:2760 stop:3482 length:723 start_codon:yes stop_codon:yes gene_type:complete
MPDTTNPSEQLSPSPPSIPNLGDVIRTDDVSRKGTGSYKADYVNWCRVAHLLHENAPGWQFNVQPSPSGSHVWEAPNGTAYVVGYFTGPNGERTPDFPQSVMDHKNAPIAFAKVSARDFTDTHRRCLCTAAAATFGLAWQLWAREKIEDPYREEEQQQEQVKANPATAPSVQDIPADFRPMDPDDREQLKLSIGDLPDKIKKEFLEKFRKEFNVQTPKVFTAIQEVRHLTWIQNNMPVVK